MRLPKKGLDLGAELVRMPQGRAETQPDIAVPPGRLQPEHDAVAVQAHRPDLANILEVTGRDQSAQPFDGLRVMVVEVAEQVGLGSGQWVGPGGREGVRVDGGGAALDGQLGGGEVEERHQLLIIRGRNASIPGTCRVRESVATSIDRSRTPASSVSVLVEGLLTAIIS